jgi:hypothetical protein
VERDPAYPPFITRQSQLRLPWCRTDWAAHHAGFSTPERDL